MFAIETNNISKIYSGKVKALEDLSINVEKGSFLGLLGPNGAGKTTLIKILLGITKQTNGSAQILGQDISDYKIKKQIGYLPENHRFPQFLTGEQVLQFFGGFSDMPKKKLDSRIEYLLELTKMKDRRKSKIKTYSKGMIQRIGIAQALVNDPDVVFLDEPTDGVDPVGRKEIRDMLLTLKDQGKTIFLNSHLLSEVELIADQVVIINKGKIVKQGTVKELTHTEQGYKISYSGELDNEFFTSDAVANKITDRKAGSFMLRAENQDELNSIIDTIRAQGILVSGIEEIKISLEDSFIELINGNVGEQK